MFPVPKEFMDKHVSYVLPRLGAKIRLLNRLPIFINIQKAYQWLISKISIGIFLKFSPIFQLGVDRETVEHPLEPRGEDQEIDMTATKESVSSIAEEEQQEQRSTVRRLSDAVTDLAAAAADKIGEGARRIDLDERYQHEW